MTDFDRIFASAPLNKTAGAVTSKGQEYVPDFKLAFPVWDAPPRILKPVAGQRDFTGTRYGRITVIGLYQRGDGQRGGASKWLVRCVCGKYEVRGGNTIKRANTDDRCQFCRHVERLKWRGSQQRSVEDFVAESCDVKESKF